ncbi:alpha/beta hydrolase [Silvibacterium sp.]|uniref:alpha/beta hydrolase n=1 Tax=Silvibacterium sp. TaxID=1964179 RepID=UPI0039E67E53
MAKQKAKARVVPAQASQADTVSPAWLLKAFFFVIAAAALCAYGTLCLLFYQGQWQLYLHPSHTVSITPATRNLKFEDVHFDVTETGTPQLEGWWVAADPASRWGSSVVLYLHDGSGSLSDTVDAVETLHTLGINVFAFDYRGFGHSAQITPGEASMNADAAAAWSYLTQTRGIPPQSIIVYGQGLGAVPATQLACTESPAGLVLDGPAESAQTLLRRDGRSHILPLWLLQKDRFDPEPALRTLALHKLFLDRAGEQPRTRQLFHAAAYPREYFELRSPSNYAEALRQFFDALLH